MTNVVAVGSLVWFDNNVGYLLPGKLISFAGKDVKVQAEESGELHVLRANAVIPRSEVGAHGVEDMIKMDDLHEGSILYNIRKRYRQDHIYTYIGSILVSVNPYMQYEIYGPDALERYNGKSLSSQPPHIFAIGNAAYQTMLRDEKNQAVIISGESGAGKTESTKQLIEFLAAVNRTNGNLITQQIVEATPLLESFGNAKTVKNDNSSRFGKYLEMFYDSHGNIAGGRVSEYLLERSRIVGQSIGERNYHIFYEMLRGLPASQREELCLGSANDFLYLNQGKTSVIPTRNEQFYFQQVVLAMDTLGIAAKEREAIFKVLAVILHLGNVDFGRTESNGQEAALIMGQSQVQVVSRLLELGTQDLVMSLTHKKTEAGGSKVMSPRTVDQAIDARDVLAKEIYSHLFSWLIEKVNGSVYKGKQNSSVAVLDIFGFEDFERNSFEQLCINFANETLQFFFNQFVFKMEQDEYASESVMWTDMAFLDNQPRLDLLAKPPYGLIHILADSTSFPKANDHSFLEKCHHYHKGNKFYGKPKTPKPEFAVNHFAGIVWYQVNGFLEKNRDGLKPDLEDLILSCNNAFIQSIFPELQSEEFSIGGLKLPAQPKNSLRMPLSQKKKPTVCGKFNDSLIRLVVAMKRCNPHFVRCIKPNNSKAAGKFEIAIVLEQLKYCGILETVKIRKAGYPIRYSFADFVKRYRCLSSHLNLNSTIPQENCSRILKVIYGIDHDSYQYGKTKVFLKEDLHESLEEARMAKLNRMAVVLQARMRGYCVNSRYLKMKKAAIVIQSNTRRLQERKRFVKARKGFILLQAIFRMRNQRRSFQKLLSESRTKKHESRTKTHAVPPVPPADPEPEVVTRSPPEIVEIEKQIVTDVTHLEIPAELALVFANIQGWHVVHESVIQEPKGDVIKHDYAVSSLPKDINEFPFSKFAQDHFKDEHQWRMLRTPLRNSLLHIKYSDNVQAVGLFQLVMRYMDDESITGSKEFAVGNYLVQMGIFKPEIREELYCQLCNQTWGNTSDASNERGWLLLCLFLCCFAPSARLYNHLLKYVSDQAYNGYKSYCQHKLLCWDMNGPAVSRSHPPSVLEWQAAKRRANMAMECHFLDGERRTAEVESCTTGEELASLLLNDRGVEDSKGWSIDLEGSDMLCSLGGKDYVLDLISELEYPPAFPLSRSSSLLTLKPGHNLPESQLKTLSNLHKTQIRGKNVAEIAYKFSFVDRQRTPSLSQPLQVHREDALSASTTAKLTTTSSSSRGPVDDRLVQRSQGDGLPSPPHTPPPPPPQASVAQPPPPSMFVPPPPPPPPPVVPPVERVILRRKLTKKDKKKRDSGPQLSMAEVVAKAQKMREARERVMSTSSSKSEGHDENENQFESAMQARVVQLKSRRVEVQQGPREEEDNELKREMRRKANRASRAFVDNELDTGATYNGEVSNDSVFVDVGSDRWTSRTSSSSFQNTGEHQHTGNLESPAELNDFVDSLFDPVLSHGVEDLSNEVALQRAMKGGGGVNQPGTSSSAVTTMPSAGSLTTASTSNGSVSGQGHAQGNGFPGMFQGNGYPGLLPGAMYYGIPQTNGAMVGIPQAHGGVMGNGVYPANMDSSMLASQQQVLIERLIAQQALLQQQQTVASQKQQEQLMILAQQQQSQLEQMRLMLAASQPAGSVQQQATQPVNKEPDGIATVQLNGPSSSSAKVVHINGHVSGRNSVDNSSVERNGVPAPPPEFSDVSSASAAPKVPIPTRTSSLPFPPPPPPVEVSSDSSEQTRPASGSFPPPPPTILARTDDPPENLDTPQRPGLKRRTTDKVALYVAALEGKSGGDETPSSPPLSPVNRGESFSFVVKSSPTKPDALVSSPREEGPQISKRSSSVMAAAAAVLLDNKDTVQHPRSTGPYLTYNHVKWKLNLRKEVFMAEEKTDNKLVQRLVFLQVVKDSYSNGCCRMSKEDCRRMQLLLQKYGITPERPHSSVPVEGIVIEAARQLPIYFSRFFVVKGQNELPDVHYLAVSEHGVKMLRREKITDELEIMRSIPYTELVTVKAVKDKLTLTLTKEVKVIVQADRAVAVKQLIDMYMRHLEKEAKYVRALYDHVSPDPSLLNFKKGDVLQIIRKDGLEDGWLYGIFNNNGGYFSADYVTHIQEDPQAVRPSNLVKAASVGNLVSPEPQSDERTRAGSVKSTRSDKSVYNSDKYSMMEFAMHYFRHGKDSVIRGDDGTIRGTIKVRGSEGRSTKGNQKKGKAEWTWKGLAELVKFSPAPIQVSLLRLESNVLNKHAVESFTVIMKFMMDQPMSKHQKETDLVFRLLTICREIPELRDEVYCQLVKQVTSNKSPYPESASRGWRLLIIITAYIQCTDVLKPYLVKFLQSTASDPKREFHGAAATCEMNIMKTFKYGGRKAHPSPNELSHLVQGRQTKRQVFVLPGGVTRMLKIQTSSTGYDVIKEICNDMDLQSEDNYKEYGLFTYMESQNVMVPVQTSDYVLDVIGSMELHEIAFSLCFRRVLWLQSLRLDNDLLVSVVYHQMLSDYMAGYLLATHDRSFGDAQFQNQIAELGALQYRGRNEAILHPNLGEVGNLVPRGIFDRLRPQQWMILLQDHFRSCHSLSPAQSRRKFLEIVTKWPYFGSTFFEVKKCSNPAVGGDCILAVNRTGVHFLHPQTKQTLLSEPFVNIISTRLLASDKGRQFLDLKMGSIMIQKVTRMETPQAKDVANLIVKYVTAYAAAKQEGQGLAGVMKTKNYRL